MGYLKGQFQSLCGLHQQINLECDYVLALAWIQTSLIIHSFATCMEDQRYESDFWEWIDEGMSGEDEWEEEVPVEGFRWNRAGPPVPGEMEGQQNESINMYKKLSFMCCTSC